MVNLKDRINGGLKQPTSVEEAKRFMGKPVTKLFAELDNFEHRGNVMDIESEIEEEDGTLLRGIWFMIQFEDEDQEHIDWKEVHKWHTYAKQRHKT